MDPNPAITAAVKVRQVAGRDLGTSASLWKPLLAHSKKGCIWIEGRVSTDRSTKYLVTARMNAGKELIVVMLVPDEKDENAKVKFSALVDTLIRKEYVSQVPSKLFADLNSQPSRTCIPLGLTAAFFSSRKRHVPDTSQTVFPTARIHRTA